MATANCTLTYVRTMDKGTNETSATYHFGYGNGGQRWVTCYKVTVPSYTGTPSSITFNFDVNRGTAYTVNRNSTWKIGLDEQAPVWSSADGAYTAGSFYAKGDYSIYGSLTNSFSGSITSSTSSFSSTFTTTSSAYVDSGSTFYVYFYSGENTYNSIKLLSISAYITYTTEAVTGTTLVVGTTSSPSSTYAYPTPSKRTVYYKVTGLANPVSSYAYFRVYLSSGFSFTNGNTYSSTSEMGTLVATYTNSSSSSYEFTSSFTIPNSSFPIGKLTGVVVVASTTAYPNRYWRIGGSDNTPKTCYIYPKSEDWFQGIISNSVKVTGKNSATITVTHRTSNNPKYVNYVELSSVTMPSVSGTDTDPGNHAGYCTCTNTSSSNSYTISQSNLSPGTTYTRHPYAIAPKTYSNNNYYGLSSISFTTDADYIGTNTSSVGGSSSASITSKVSSTINLDGYIYYSTASDLTSKPSTKKEYDSSREISVSLSGLNADASYTYYFYVYSSESGNLYSIGSTSFTTDAEEYAVEIPDINAASTRADLYVTNITPKTNLVANIVYLSSAPTYDSYYFYYSCVSHGILNTHDANGAPLSYEIDINGMTYYIQLNSHKAPDAELRIYPQDYSVVSAGDFDIYTSLQDGSVLGDEQLYFETAFGESADDIVFESYYVSPGYGSIRLTDLEPGREYTRYIYVKSSVSGNYYLGAIVVFKTNSYIYRCEDSGALTPCWTYIYDDDTGGLVQVVLEVPSMLP